MLVNLIESRSSKSPAFIPITWVFLIKKATPFDEENYPGCASVIHTVQSTVLYVTDELSDLVSQWKKESNPS